MPRQIKKGLKLFKEVKPFVTDYIDKTRWWKIEINPTTLCGYTMPYLGYLNVLNYTMYSDAVYIHINTDTIYLEFSMMNIIRENIIFMLSQEIEMNSQTMEAQDF